MEKHYAERDIFKQGDYYTKHVSAMTGEALYSKSAIAAELAHRDIEIDRLRAALQPFANVGGWFFARPEVPDETPVVDLCFINGVAGALTRGQFKAANSALVPNTGHTP